MNPADDAFSRAIRGTYNPTLRPPSAGPPITSETDPASIQQCASCGADIVPRVTAWGTNWLPERGNGLCAAAHSGVHAPAPEEPAGGDSGTTNW